MIAVSFTDHRQVETIRCYQGDAAGPCRRILVYARPDDDDPRIGYLPALLHDLGWREIRMDYVRWGARLEWRCPDHAGEGLQ